MAGETARCTTCGIWVGEGGMCHCPDIMEAIVEGLRCSLADARAAAAKIKPCPCAGTGRRPIGETTVNGDGRRGTGSTLGCDCREGWRLACEQAEAEAHTLRTRNDALQAKNDEQAVELEELRAAGPGAGKYHRRRR